MDRRAFLLTTGVGALQAFLLTAGGVALDASPDSSLSMQAGNALSPTWFKRFHGQSTYNLLFRRRFRLFVQSHFAGMRMPFWHYVPLWSAVRAYFNNPNLVEVHHHRYVTMSGVMAHFGLNRGMLWIDTKAAPGTPSVVFAFLNVKGPSQALWIVPNAQGLETIAPRHFAVSLSSWLGFRRPQARAIGPLTNLTLLGKAASAQPAQVYPDVLGVKPFRFAPGFKVASIKAKA